MKKIIVIVVLGVVAAALGANWYYTREVRQQLDQVARAASMFGDLTYDSVRLSFDGEIHINELAFQLRQPGADPIRIERVALDAGGLGGIVSLQGQLESGELPPELGIRFEGLTLSFDGMPSTMPGGQADGSTGLLFAAAGCDGRRAFDIDDLVEMDYRGWAADLGVRYRLVDRGDRLHIESRVRNREAGELAVEFTLELMSGSNAAAAVMAAAQRANLSAFSLGFEDLGFYDRMLAFCADETGLSRDAYVDRHIEAWRERWLELDAEPEPALVDAYREFIESPDELRLQSRSAYSVPVVGLGEYSLPELLGRMETTLAVNDAEPVPMALTEVEPEADGEQAPALADAGRTGRESSGERTVREPAGTSSRRAASVSSSSARGPSWVEVEPAALAGHVDRRIRVETMAGRSFRGRLARVESDSLHIRVQGTGGYYIRPVERDGIRSVSVWLDAG